MADSPVDCNREQKDNTDKKRNILEEKSKEDLIKLVKKYLNLLQKSKNKTDELTEKCLILEKEKHDAVQAHLSSEKELNSKIEALQHDVSELKAENSTFADKDKEIEELQQKLKEVNPSVRENEDQLQCLNLQLHSLKASCQCMQEENKRLQESNKEKLEELRCLVSTHESLSSDFNKKLEEYDVLLNMKNDIEAKYEKSVEKLHSLQTKTDKLVTENEYLQKNKAELNDEISKLEKKIQQTENSDITFFLDDIQTYKKKIKKLEKQIEDLSKNKSKILTENEPDNSNLGINASEIDNKVLKLQKTNSVLEQEKQFFEEQNMALQSKLDMCHIQIHKLEEEIKNLATSSQLSDYKMGIEFALLQGATTENLTYPFEQLSPKKEIPQPNESNICKKSDKAFKTKSICPTEGVSGLEWALLQGGDPSSLAMGSSELSDTVFSAHVPHKKFINTIPISNDRDIILNYENVLREKEAEIKTLKENLKEYSSLCSDTIEENNSLKEELEKLKKKSFIDQETNTDTDLNYVESIKELEQTKTECTNAESIYLSHEDETKLCENYQNLCDEIINFYKKIQSEGHFDAKQDKSDYGPLDLFADLKNLYTKIMSDFEKKKLELNDFNLQLELLVIGVRQGVRQKTSDTSYQAENNIEENMNILKLLLEELSTRSSCFESKKMVQSHSVNEIQLMEDELLQLKELNQFLNDENRELNNEIRKLKCSLNDQKYDDVEYVREVHQQNAELYSIDETNEFDDKNESVKETPSTCEVSIQTFFSVQEASVQIESDFSFQKMAKVENANIQTDSSEDNSQQIIEQLANENKCLKNVVNEKSTLVENIHCEMDRLLTKVEELAVELQNKEDDLKHLQDLNTDLKKNLTETQNIKNQQLNALKITHNIILEFKEKNKNLINEINSLSLTYKEFMTNVNCDISKNIELSNKHFDHLREICIHKENNFVILREWINEFIKECEDWHNFINQITPEDLIYDMSKLERTIQESSEAFILFKDLCNKDACCNISENINQLISSKMKLFSSFYNHLNNYYRSLLNDLHNYKINIIPNMEKNIVELEGKIAEYKSLDNSTSVKVVTDNVQGNSAEESLKNTLADTEIKMNKFKQIALKMKKELTQTKGQYNDVIMEKEKLLKQNEKFSDELNRISDEQCKYVQNYQSLQNEFDKLQDDCEIYKLNMKKLEDDLAAKLLELTSSKEQVLELESQLKSSKHLLDSNLSMKKELDIKCADLESKIIILESKIAEKEQKITSVENIAAKYLKDVNAAQEDNKNLKYQLELAQKEGNKKSLLDLEMADYERSITELNNKIRKKEDEVEELKNEIQSMKERNNCLQDELKSTETLKETEAKRAENLKGILEKTKSELNNVKEHESELLSKTASFEVQIETMTQQEEDFKLRLSETTAQIQHLQDVIKTTSENHQRIVRSFEQKISNLKQEILLAHKEVESGKQEFENYKIRVHSVLKQQKSVTPSITTIDCDLKEKLETMNEKLKLQVKDLSEKITAMTLEYETLQEEHDGLLQRYNKAIDDREQKDKEWHQRLELINAEKNRLRINQEELSSQHMLQNEMLVATYKKQIKIMSDEHKRIVNDLQKQLDAADVEISRLQRDQQKLQGLPVTPSPQDSTSSFDLLSQERQEGEGSENTDEAVTPIRPLSLATIPTSGFLPFEKLLLSPVEPGTPASYISNYDSEKLAADLNAANKKIDHLNELLNDSESSNLRLSEQVRVLKDEVRRLENNKERQQHAENLEYLKNVFIKFATLQPGSEKAMLIPVLTTMLKLNSSEQQQLKSIAGDLQSSDNINAGWGGYLHRWSGLS